MKVKVTPLRLVVSIGALLIVLTGVALCALRGLANISAYSNNPITIDCAYRAVVATDGVTSVTMDKYAIKFEGWTFSGRLFHGTEGEPFTRFGLDLETSLFVSDGPDALSRKLGNSLREICGA